MGRAFTIAAILALALPGTAAAQALNPTRAEIDAFVRADGNGDQKLDPPEFRAFVRAMAETGQPTAKQIRFFGAYGLAFKIADADRDGVVTPLELRAADDGFREENGRQ